MQTYLIKAILSDRFGRVKGNPYRIIAISENFTLYQLADAICGSFDFDFDHAFGFYNNIKSLRNSVECYELFADMEDVDSECKSVEKFRISKVFSQINKKMLFLFDYGDEWRFIVELKGIKTTDEQPKYAAVVKSVGDAPLQYDEMD